MPSAPIPEEDHNVTEQTDRPKRRQARGERRIAEVLEAAGAVFAESGYSAATTNAIAARAGISPGSLYQYFPNKDAIADALAEAYLAGLGDAYDQWLDPQVAALPLSDLLDRVVDPLVEYNVSHPACMVLFLGPDVPQRYTEAHRPLQLAMVTRFETLMARLAPDTTPADLHRAAAIALYVFTGVLPLVLAAEGSERDALVIELKKVLHGYLGAKAGPTALSG